MEAVPGGVVVLCGVRLSEGVGDAVGNAEGVSPRLAEFAGDAEGDGVASGDGDDEGEDSVEAEGKTVSETTLVRVAHEDEVFDARADALANRENVVDPLEHAEPDE